MAIIKKAVFAIMGLIAVYIAIVSSTHTVFFYALIFLADLIAAVKLPQISAQKYILLLFEISLLL